MNTPSASWRQKGLKESNGIMVGCDEKLEWMLPWWWKHYHTSNFEEVVFVDFGLSAAGKEWCEQHGELIALDVSSHMTALRADISPEKIELWEKIYHPSRLWTSRPFWFMKPFAMLQSPFKQTIWMDVDCEVRGSIKPIFDYCHAHQGVALVPEPFESQMKQINLGLIKPEEKVYNTGVVGFRYSSLVIQKWAEAAGQKSSLYPGNQNLLAAVIREEKFQINELPAIYNWRMGLGENPEAIIVHWVSSTGKQQIWHQIQNEQE